MASGKKILFCDLKRQYFSIEKNIDRTIKRVLASGWYVLGKEVKSFEREFADYCDCSFGVGVGSGTDAIYISLKALGIGKGDDVITQANTAIPTAMAITKTGARIKLIDVDEEDYNMDIEKLKNISKKAKAIIPVHLYGNPCRMDEIMRIAAKKSFYIIEDACQAHGAKYNGKYVGTFGITGCFSFYPTKNLGCYGDGGMIITNNRKIYRKIILLRNYGQINRYNSVLKGVNSRLDEIQASCLRFKLNRLDEMNEKRQKLASRYSEALSGIGDIKIKKERVNATAVCHLYVIRTRYRDKLKRYLAHRNIMTEIHYPVPIHLQKSFKDLGYSKGDFRVSEELCREVLTLPMFPKLKFSEVDKICDAIKRFFRFKK